MYPKLIFYNNSTLLEGARFDIENNLLYFVSILDELIYCYNINNQQLLSIKTSGPVGCVQIIGYKKLVSAEKNGIFNIDFNNLNRVFLDQLNDDENLRYNDGILDKKGRFLVGTMGHPKIIDNAGKVYSFDGKSFKILINNTTISNGMVFSHDYNFLYFIDTPIKKVARYCYNLTEGEVKFDKYIIEFDGTSLPDGMCIDKDGLLWIAEWNGGAVSQFDPESGKKIQSIKIPCKNVTSCCLDNNGGMYVTTAKNELDDEPFAGGLFYLKL
jgi:sugar lactone lactonase YvrE